MEMGVVVHTVIPAIWEAKLGGLRSEACPGQRHKTLLEKINKAKRAGGVVQVIVLANQVQGPEFKP
jgi:hypothetical protein